MKKAVKLFLYIYSLPIYIGVLLVRNFAFNKKKGIDDYTINIGFWISLINTWFTVCVLLPFLYPDLNDYQQKYSRYEGPIIWFLVIKIAIEHIIYGEFKVYKKIAVFYDKINNSIRIPLLVTVVIIWIVIVVISLINMYYYLP